MMEGGRGVTQVVFLAGYSSRGQWAGEWWRPEDLWGDPAWDHHFKVSCTITSMAEVKLLKSPGHSDVSFIGSSATWRRRSRTRLTDSLDSTSSCFILNSPVLIICLLSSWLMLVDLLYFHSVSLHCVQGCYPPDFMEAWDMFDQDKCSENDRPGEWEPPSISLSLCSGSLSSVWFWTHVQNPHQCFSAQVRETMVMFRNHTFEADRGSDYQVTKSSITFPCIKYLFLSSQISLLRIKHS